MKSNLNLTLPGTAPAAAGHGCGCGCGGAAKVPSLRVTDIPKSVRHGALIGGLTSLSSGGQLVLIAPHDPKPLLAQLAETAPDTFEIEYLANGPDEWQLQFTRH